MTGRPRASALPRGVWALGAVSLFMDVSSELIHSLLPLFLVNVLGVSSEVFGLIEGTSEGAVMITKLVSGALSDRLRRRKALAVAGYGLATAVKPLFPLADSAATVFAARLLDRVGKGIRGAPRDALVADLTPAPLRGAAYGLRQALDSVGAVGGPVLAFALMTAHGGNLRTVMWWATPPALIAVAVLLLAVRDPPSVAVPDPKPSPRLAAALGPDCWRVIALGTGFTLARFSEGFLLLRASGLGVEAREVPLALAAMSAVYALSAYPAGRLSDRIGRPVLLALGAGVLAVADLVLAAASGTAALAAGIALWGLHMGLTQGLLSALVADAAPGGARGTAFGVFSLGQGIALFLASTLAGALWEMVGPDATFGAGAAFAIATAVGALLIARRKSKGDVSAG